MAAFPNLCLNATDVWTDPLKPIEISQMTEIGIHVDTVTVEIRDRIQMSGYFPAFGMMPQDSVYVFTIVYVWIGIIYFNILPRQGKLLSVDYLKCRCSLLHYSRAASRLGLHWKLSTTSSKGHHMSQHGCCVFQACTSWLWSRVDTSVTPALGPLSHISQHAFRQIIWERIALLLRFYCCTAVMFIWVVIESDLACFCNF